MNQLPGTIILSRTDSIGDVILTLPLAGYIKSHWPESKVIFLGSKYTRAVVNSCPEVDEFIDWSTIKSLDLVSQQNEIEKTGADAIVHVFPDKKIASLAKKAGIPIRIGASGRLYHYPTCNKIVSMTRRRSTLHEAQLNFKLMKPFGVDKGFSLPELSDWLNLKPTGELPQNITDCISKDRFNLVLHPRSKGSAREWGLKNFKKLIDILDKEKFNLMVSGTQAEAEQIRHEMPGFFEGVTDLTGKLTLDQLISFISKADGLVAASTGPLHIAAAVGIHAMGIYPPIKPMHPGRWAPIGKKVKVFVADKTCNICRNGSTCECMINLTPEIVANYLNQINTNG